MYDAKLPRARLERVATILNKPQIFNTFFIITLPCCGKTTGTRIVAQHDDFANAFATNRA
jgi:hypothetical protein